MTKKVIYNRDEDKLLTNHAEFMIALNDCQLLVQKLNKISAKTGNREFALARTKLDEASMWLEKGCFALTNLTHK